MFSRKKSIKKIRTEATQIFNKFCGSMKDLRNEINNENDGNYFFTINSLDIFYLV